MKLMFTLLSVTLYYKSNKATYFRYNDKQKWYRNLDGYLQQTNILKMICPICLTNIPFSLARRIFTIVENENVKEKCF